MMLVKVNWNDGDSTTTRINATPEEAKEHYVGRTFNVGLGSEDDIKKCMSIEILKEDIL